MRSRPASSESTTSERVLDVTERLVQTRGYNGFSYADVAAEISITTASLHYHFPTKADLGARLVERYCRRFKEALAGIEAEQKGALKRLHAYAELYASVVRDRRMCLCGMLASDQRTLPAPIRRHVKRFFDLNDIWLQRVLDAGRDSGELRFNGRTSDGARALVAALEGAMLIAHACEDPKRFEAPTRHLLGQLVTREREYRRSSGSGNIWTTCRQDRERLESGLVGHSRIVRRRQGERVRARSWSSEPSARAAGRWDPAEV